MNMREFVTKNHKCSDKCSICDHLNNKWTGDFYETIMNDKQPEVMEAYQNQRAKVELPYPQARSIRQWKY